MYRVEKEMYLWSSNCILITGGPGWLALLQSSELVATSNMCQVDREML